MIKKFALALFASLPLASAIVGCGVLAFAAATHATDAPRIPAALVISRCNLVVGVVLTDEKGGIHPVDVEKLTLDQVLKLVSQAESATQATLPCSSEDKAA